MTKAHPTVVGNRQRDALFTIKLGLYVNLHVRKTSTSYT